MRCKRHPLDASSGVGICASCLRERLFSLIAAQARQQALTQIQIQPEDRRKSDAHHPPPLVFPRSVSPYIYRRSSSEPSCEHHQFDQRFYSTPQLRPISATNTTTNTSAGHKKKQSKFSLFASLFSRFRSEETDPDVTDPGASRLSRSSLATTSSSSSSPISQTSFSALFPSRPKKLSRLCRGPRPCGHKNRGMSPARDTNEDDYNSSSDYSSKTSPIQREQGLQAQSTPTRARRRGQHNRNVSGLAMCFSPLVRPSPSSHHRNVGFSGEVGDIRASSKPHLSTAVSFHKNRSRKLADIGRFNP